MVYVHDDFLPSSDLMTYKPRIPDHYGEKIDSVNDTVTLDNYENWFYSHDEVRRFSHQILILLLIDSILLLRVQYQVNEYMKSRIKQDLELRTKDFNSAQLCYPYCFSKETAPKYNEVEFYDGQLVNMYRICTTWASPIIIL